MENYQRFKLVFDQLLKKHLPRCKALLAIDSEYLKRTMVEQKEACEESIKSYMLKDMNTLP